ncbi:hypothetical protein [Psychrobacter sp. M13]|uniref:hypothetical protein n=1 Tax=Psychrobacter sp. M13 TaxID=3067275 RepID=UPI00273BFE92|nr:hypothetical protein [Psychrobacter sp. M13]WLP95909.1 hypothetical protein Q9G97_06775 [Psychrobacter sp. M13]
MNIDYLKIEKVMTVNKEHKESSEKIKRIMQDNPDLSYEFVHQLLIAQAEVDAGKVEPYEFG